MCWRAFPTGMRNGIITVPWPIPAREIRLRHGIMPGPRCRWIPATRNTEGFWTGSNGEARLISNKAGALGCRRAQLTRYAAGFVWQGCSVLSAEYHIVKECMINWGNSEIKWLVSCTADMVRINCIMPCLFFILWYY